MKNPIYVTGHKNPDTDSIVSAIAYAEYKKAKGINAIAGRIGAVPNSTEFLLDQFGFEEPKHLFSAKCTIGEIDYDKAVLVSKDITIKEALAKITKTETRTIFVTNKQKQLEGVLSLSNLNDLWTANEIRLKRLLKNSSFKNIVKVLNAEVVHKSERFSLNGNVELAPIYDEQIHKDDVVITANEDRLKQALEAKAGLIIVVGRFENLEKYSKEIIKQDVNVIKTKQTPLKLSKLIYQASSIENVMVSADKVIKAYCNETIDECLHKMSKTRFRLYPVLNDNKEVVGALSRYHLVNYEKKKYILVDHNEKKQTVDDIDYGEVIEIVDHHRIGGFSCDNPISVSTMAVGATATIVAEKFLSEKISLSKNLAGLLLGAILSDTMNFNSPTTTPLDKKIAKELEMISKVDSNELYKELVSHKESLLTKKSIDILYEDYKEFEVNGIKFGISQATCRDKNEYNGIKDSIEIALEENCRSKQFDLMICMFTLSTGDGSYLMAKGDKQEIIKNLYPNMKENYVKKLISRKKQLLPDLIKELSQ